MSGNQQQQRGQQPQQRPGTQVARPNQDQSAAARSRYADEITRVTRDIQADKDTLAGLLKTNVGSSEFGQFVNEVDLAISKAWAKNGSNPLLDADPGSFRSAVREAAGFGFSLNPRLGEAFLIPRKGKVEMQSGYKGLVKLGWRSGILSSIHAECVYKGEKYKRIGGSENPRIKHDPDDTGPLRTNKWPDIVCAYAVVFVGDSTRSIYQVAPRWRLSLARGEGTTDAWRSHPDSMCRKTALIMVANEMPRHDQLRQFHLAVQREIEMESDGSEFVITVENRSEDAGAEWQRAVAAYTRISITEENLVAYLGLASSNEVTGEQLALLEEIFKRAWRNDQAAAAEVERMRANLPALVPESESEQPTEADLHDAEPALE
jgi:phage RecT family recombinase